jgi:hypothetical protein
MQATENRNSTTCEWYWKTNMVVSSKQSEVYTLCQETRDANIDITPSALCWLVARQTDGHIHLQPTCPTGVY